MLRTSKEQNRFKTYLAESYIQSLDLVVSLRLDHTFVSAKWAVKLRKETILRSFASHRKTRPLPSRYWI